MSETPLQQIHSKVYNYIHTLISQINDSTINISDLPLSQIKELITTHYLSSSEYLNPTASFHNNIENFFVIITQTIQDNNTSLCSSLLEILCTQLESFVTLETSWNYTIDYNSMLNQFNTFSKGQWERHTLPMLPHGNQFTGKGVIYTSVTGGYDILRDPDYINTDLDYICFTDNDSLTSDVWTIKHISNPDQLDPVRLARRHKILCNEYVGEYDFSIWVDGKIQISGDLTQIIRDYHMFSPMLCVPHYDRDCIYIEADTCIALSKGNSSEITRQIEKYKNENYPQHNGLIESCVLCRVHNNPELEIVLQTWWNEVVHESTRDQLSFNYSCWKNDFYYDLCNFSIYHNPYFTIEDHAH